MQKFLGFNRNAYWPIHFTSITFGIKNICVGIDSSPGYSGNCYIQGSGKIFIGDYTQIGPGVGIISGNHDIYSNDNRKHIRSFVRFGNYCWIGMNSVILPGVELGDFTIVAAGAIVTTSFKHGYCVVGGNPAKIIKKINKDDCLAHEHKYKYNGYIKNTEFDTFRKTKLIL